MLKLCLRRFMRTLLHFLTKNTFCTKKYLPLNSITSTSPENFGRNSKEESMGESFWFAKAILKSQSVVLLKERFYHGCFPNKFLRIFRAAA